MSLRGVDTERSSGEGVGGTAAGGEGEGVCPVVLSSSASCEVVCEDTQTAPTRPQSLSWESLCWCTGQMMVRWWGGAGYTSTPGRAASLCSKSRQTVYVGTVVTLLPSHPHRSPQSRIPSRRKLRLHRIPFPAHWTPGSSSWLAGWAETAGSCAEQSNYRLGSGELRMHLDEHDQRAGS